MCRAHIAAPTAIIIASSSTYGSVTVSQGLGSNWIGTPTIETAGSLTLFTVPEQNYGSSAPYSLSQSFLATSSGTLDNIQLYVSGTFSSNTIHFYDLGSGALPSSYTPGSGSTSADLLSPYKMFAALPRANPSVLELQFSGIDAVFLVAGHNYVFEIVPWVSPGLGLLTWHSSSGDIYAGGMAFGKVTPRSAFLAPLFITTTCSAVRKKCILLPHTGAERTLLHPL